MKTLKLALVLFILILLQACSSLAEWKQEISRSPSFWDSAPTLNTQAPVVAAATPRHGPTWNSGALRVNKGALVAAQDRWPWAQGYQLQRRAQILQLGPNYNQLSDLDTSSDSRNEIAILKNLLEQRQQFASSGANANY